MAGGRLGPPRGDADWHPSVCVGCGEQPKLVIRDGYSPYLQCGCGVSDIEDYGLPDRWLDEHEGE